MIFNKTNRYFFKGKPRRLDVRYPEHKSKLEFEYILTNETQDQYSNETHDLKTEFKHISDELCEKYEPDTFITNKGPNYAIKIPSLTDDFYTNILDWKLNNIFYSIGSCLYLFDNITGKRHKLYTFKIIITSLKSYDSENIILGFKNGKFLLFNFNKLKYNILPSHLARVTNIDVNNNRIFTGSEDRKIRLFDIRENETEVLGHHTLEVTGIKSNKRCDLLASGGNDNMVYVFDLRTTRCILNYEHTAAIRAITWSKFDVLVTGGGTADRNIQMWNISSLKKENEKYLNSQICNLYWTNNNKIISTHGYSQNDMKIFNTEFNLSSIYPSQSSRVIHFAVNENETQFVTGCTDNYLKFWSID